ncbi:MAG: UDP-galactopyranose mutase [Ignavibacteria bacterium GWB2_35_12]|nr:MAG: UDP-galactopyranose mutase [Ignavibacteria bacterium GWA2_35_8]OGU38377.1 MAG: UDP-galactopyranose mutase [Ignavibacteria bacterium GWB2_35_12]OGU94174.1 MAG: UDP-galactopyranose mutase [Ignavibacteria bacterium RIFOXYA2_FULL_35_10]OGV23386.1 MAG: UDP-galactopyranose mutase [Ignavibacteria bacterium RIFOXYC2_FULL_35_21]
MMYDYLIVGGGFAGCVIAERIASQLGKKVLIIDRRNHIAGNAHDYYDNNGILIHKYGPHIFHTSSKKVWDYLSNFTEWIPYEHTVMAVVNGKKVPVPFNLNSIEQVFPKKIASKYQALLLEKYGYGLKIPILKLLENKQEDLKVIADFIYQNIFYGYTLKQWGLKPEELDFSVTSRVPVFISHDNRYFQDTYQGIPEKGYTELFNKLIKNKNIEVLLNTDYKINSSSIKFNKLIYTGPIDEYFDYKFGKLPYRSLHFDFKTFKKEWFQEVAQVNYPNDFDYTRITEFKHFHRQKTKATTVAFEFPQEFELGKNEPYYPIQNVSNNDLYNRYKKESEKLKNTIFVGRLAEYKYYNMDQIVGVALMKFDKEIAK